MIIYADIVFLINFFGDFLCLWILSEIEGKISVRRRILAASIGGVYAVICTYPSLRWCGGTIGKAALAAVMVAVGYMPMGIKKLFRSTAVFFMTSMLLAGGAELIGAKLPYKIMLTIFAVCCFLICAMSALRSKVYAKYTPCCLSYLGKKVHIQGFYDSGNRLLAGDNSAPVLIGDERVLKKLISKEVTWKGISEWVDAKRLVSIPFTGAAKGEMQGVVLDYAKVGEHTYYDAVLAISEVALADSLVLNSIMV